MKTVRTYIIFIDITYSLPRLRGCARISISMVLLGLTRDSIYWIEASRKSFCFVLADKIMGCRRLALHIMMERGEALDAWVARSAPGHGSLSDIYVTLKNIFFYDRKIVFVGSKYPKNRLF